MKTTSLLIISLFIVINSMSQTVIWQNSVTPAPYTGFLANVSYSPVGQQFLMNNPNLSVQEVVLYLSSPGNNSSTNLFTVSIYNDNGNNTIGTKVTDLKVGNTANFVGDPVVYTINSSNCDNHSLPLTLTAGNKYWICVSSSDEIGITWYYDYSNAAVNGDGASTNAYTYSLGYRTNKPFFMKITAGAVTSNLLENTISDKVTVSVQNKTIQINSDLESCNVELITASGAEVMSQSLLAKGKIAMNANVPSGCYLIKITSAGRCFTKKILIR